jgi:hypothetical protein
VRGKRFVESQTRTKPTRETTKDTSFGTTHAHQPSCARLSMGVLARIQTANSHTAVTSAGAPTTGPLAHDQPQLYHHRAAPREKASLGRGSEGEPSQNTSEKGGPNPPSPAQPRAQPPLTHVPLPQSDRGESISNKVADPCAKEQAAVQKHIDETNASNTFGSFTSSRASPEKPTSSRS